MAQHDYNIANQSGAAFRADLNNALLAIVSQNSGTSAPSTTFAHQFWADTTTGTLKIRNAANSAWIELMQLDGTLTMEDGTALLPGLAFRDDLNTGLFSDAADTLGISTGGVERVEFGTTATVFNDGGADVDFRIEGDTNANLFFVDAGNDRVGLGTSSPSDVLHVVGTIRTSSGSNSAQFANNFLRSNQAGTFFFDHNSGSQDFQFRVSNSTELDTTAMTIKSNGRVGIGTTSPVTPLDVVGGAIAVSGGLPSDLTNRLVLENSSNLSTITSYGATSGTGALRFITGGGGGSSGAEAARIDSSRRLLVGTTTAFRADSFIQVKGGNSSSVGSLALASTSTNPTSGTDLGFITITDTGGNRGASIIATADANWTSGTSQPTRLAFSTTADGASAPTERMRITNTGAVRIAVGTNTDTPGFGNTTTGTGIRAGGDVFMSCSGAAPLYINRNSTTGTLLSLRYNGTERGWISTDGTVVAYNTGSDYRLKENIAAVTDGITRLQQLKPSRFNFIENPAKTVDGFIAHEVQDIVPEAVSGAKDEVEVWKEGEILPDGVSVGDNKLDEDGNTIPVYQGIDQSKLVPLLTAALQEAIGEIESLKARVAALEVN